MILILDSVIRRNAYISRVVFTQFLIVLRFELTLKIIPLTELFGIREFFVSTYSKRVMTTTGDSW